MKGFWLVGLCLVFVMGTVSFADDATVPEVPEITEEVAEEVEESSTGFSYQGWAQYKANLMASRGVLSHRIAAVYGAEGIGCGYSPNCATCTFAGAPIADAVALSSNGMYYRVRIWASGSRNTTGGTRGRVIRGRFRMFRRR